VKGKRKIAVWSIITLFAFSGLLTLASAHTITVPPTNIFGLPLYNTRIGFSSVQSFDTVYRTADNNASFPSWLFIDGYGLQTVNLNITITRFFTGKILEYTITGTSGGVLSIYNPLDADPYAVVGESSYSYNPTSHILTINLPNVGAASVDWNTPTSGGGGGGSTPAPSSTPIPSTPPGSTPPSNDGGGGVMPTPSLSGPPYIPNPQEAGISSDLMMYGEIGVLATIAVAAIAGVNSRQPSLQTARNNLRNKKVLLGGAKKQKRKNMLQ
jgi:hypothetical protein